MNRTVEQQDNEYFLRLFNGIADAVFISECCSDGTPGKYIEVNDVACDMLQFTRDQLLKLSPYQISRVALEDKSTFAAILDDIKVSGKTLFKTELMCRSGHWVPVEIGSQLFELDGKTVFFSVARDITLREKYEESIQTLVRSTVGLTGQECLDEIVRNLCNWLHVDGACIGVMHGDTLEIRASFLDDQYQSPSRLAVADSPFQQVLKGQFCIYPDNATPLFSANYFLPSANISSYIGSPMFGHDKQVMGCVCAYSRE
ncbi:MAG: PAS domain-containing protein, partial [Desulfuromusa sp.]|nr:PAS domain-containing protein [Desulfuromusa sp.]